MVRKKSTAFVVLFCFLLYILSQSAMALKQEQSSSLGEMIGSYLHPHYLLGLVSSAKLQTNNWETLKPEPRSIK